MTLFGVPARIARIAIAILVALDLVALAGLSLHRTTTTTTTFRPATQSVPTGTSPGSATTGPPTLTAPSVPSSQTIPVSDNTGAATSTTDSTTSGKKAGNKPKTPPKATPPSGGVPPITEAEIGKCPVKLAEPAQMGGLQSFVPFAPAFGPFSAEAFAAAAAYQPELELLGPILAQYPQFAPKVEPLLDPLLTLFGSGANSLFDLISPLYTPKRTQVLDAETKLAAFFAPYSKKLAGQPLAGCVVDLEAALVGDTKASKSSAADRIAAVQAAAKATKSGTTKPSLLGLSKVS